MIANKANTLRALMVAAMAALFGFGLVIEDAAAYAPSKRDGVKQMLVGEALKSRNVSPSLALAVAKVESNFNPSALSSAGARGVMQIMPATGRGVFGVQPDDLWSASLNVQLGVRFLGDLIDQYGGRWDLALSHYNGGTVRGNKVKPATAKYVKAVLAWQRKYDRNATITQMVASMRTRAGNGGAGVQYAQVPSEFMMRENPGVVRDWRHYLNVADYWLTKPWQKEAARVAQAQSAAAATPANGLETPVAQVQEQPAVQTPAVEPYWPIETSGDFRPSQRLRQKISERRARFRQYLNGGGVRRGRFNS